MRTLTFLIPFILAGAHASPSSDAIFAHTLAPELSQYLADFKVAPRPASNPGVPAGFEALMLEQTTLVDVYFANRFLVSTLATFTPGTIAFDNPEHIVEHIPTLLDRKKVLAVLHQNLSTNSELRCYSRQQTNCGLLQPDIAEVIFNNDNYRVDLFVAPSLLTVQQNIVQKYLGPSSAGLSFFQTFNYAVSSSAISTLQSINGRSILSIKETSLEVLSDRDSENDFNITSMNLQRDWQGRRYQGGYISTNSNNLRFSQNANILGFRIGTTLDTREDLRQTTGNTIEIFLPLRSRVSLFKDERLVSSRFYEPGNQQLDTSSLPGGAYDVEIVINDAAGERRETRFYSKSARIPPADQPQYFIEGGRITERTTDTLPDTLPEHLWRAGYSRRLSGSSSFTVGISGNDTNTMFEAGWFGIFPWLESSIDIAATEDSRQGINVSIRLPIFSSQIFIDHRQVWDNNLPTIATNDLLGPRVKQAALTTVVPLFGRTVSLSARYNSRATTGSERTLTSTFHLKDWRIGNSTLRSNLQWVRQNDEDTLLFTIGFFKSGERMTFNLNSEYNHIDGPMGTDGFARGSTSLSYRNNVASPTAVYAQVNSRHQVSDNTFGFEVDAKGRFGRVRGQVERGDDTIYTGSYATSLVATHDSFAFGGQELNRAAIVIDLSKSDGTDKNHFDVLVNNSAVATALPGRRTIVPVTPYSHYDVNLRARGSGFISFTDRTHSVTLYPGNAVNLSWQADSVVIAFGELTDQDGRYVSNALIHGVAGLATTDDFGNFQAEISPATKELRFETIKQECTLKLPDYDADNGIAFLPPLTCELANKN